ncbi:MAG TPA: hypothetical protein VGB93_13970, partial [Methylovirgula sp.]
MESAKCPAEWRLKKDFAASSGPGAWPAEALDQVTPDAVGAMLQGATEIGLDSAQADLQAVRNLLRRR